MTDHRTIDSPTRSTVGSRRLGCPAHNVRAAEFEKNLDRIAAPKADYFRGSVAWSIRTNSTFMRLPTTYTR